MIEFKNVVRGILSACLQGIASTFCTDSEVNGYMSTFPLHMEDYGPRGETDWRDVFSGRP
jgi:hypothetical protein